MFKKMHLSKITTIISFVLILSILVSAFTSCGGKKSPVDSSDPAIKSPTDANGIQHSGLSSGGTDSVTGVETAVDSPSGGNNANNAGGNNQPQTTPPSQAGDKGNVGVSGERKLEGNIYTAGMPIAEKKITLRIMAEKTTMHADFKNMPFTKEYEKMTNIKIDWDLYSTSERVAKKTLAMASGNSPEIVCMLDAFNSADIIDYSSQGRILSLNDSLSKWAPNVNKALNTNAAAKSSVTAPDGNIYSVPFINSVSGHDDFPNKMYINKAWLSNLGLKTPTTYDELINVLRKFKNGDPNGNGQKDEIPLAVPAFDPMLSGAPQGVSWNWTNDRMYVDDSGKIGYYMASTAHRDSIKFFKTLWNESLLDKGVFEGTSTTAGKASSGKVGVFTALAGVITLPDKELKNYTILPPIKATPSSKATVLSAQSNQLMPFAFVVTATAKKDQKKEAALRWVDYFFTTDGYILEQYGPPTGGYYKKNSDGKLETLPKKSDSDRYKVAPGYVLPSWYTLGCKDAWKVIPDKDKTESQKYFTQIDEGLSEKYYRPVMKKQYISSLFFGKAESATLRTKGDGVHSSAFNESMEFVKGNKNIDTGWNDYVNNLKRLGLDDMVSAYQKSYNASK